MSDLCKTEMKPDQQAKLNRSKSNSCGLRSVTNDLGRPQRPQPSHAGFVMLAELLLTVSEETLKCLMS